VRSYPARAPRSRPHPRPLSLRRGFDHPLLRERLVARIDEGRGELLARARRRSLGCEKIAVDPRSGEVE
jgi:hypothetical protein